MEYVVGSVAALVSGNVTPSRPKYLKRALTPTKHQPSPNVTPKSEVTDRSIFLSPTLQKKKAIVKKSPKRIFDNPDLDVTDEGNSSIISPKADKVKKHLQIELDASASINSSLLSPESPKDHSDMLSKMPKKNSKVKNVGTHQNKKKRKQPTDTEHVASINVVSADDLSPKKKKKETKLLSQNSDNVKINIDTVKNPKKNRKQPIDIEHVAAMNAASIDDASPKRKKNQTKPLSQNSDNVKIDIDTVKNPKNKKSPVDQPIIEEVIMNPKKQNKKIKAKKNKNQLNTALDSKVLKNKISSTESNENLSDDDEDEDYVNPNAITNQDTDSEHDSDDDMESENDEENKKALQPEESSDEEEKEEIKKDKPEEKQSAPLTEDEIKRTIFVGNVPFSKKCKREVKKIFTAFGTIESIRIRTVPVKDPSVTPKLAIIKGELHPDRSTVNVYVKFANADSVDKALTANNTVLNEHHLRVTRSNTTGELHDPKCAVFVGNIPFALEDEALRATFEKCGEIESVRIIRDRKTNAGKGFGYVNFTSKDGVELALALSEEDLTIKNRILRVKRCTQTEQKNKATRPPKELQKQFRSGNNQGGYGRFRPGGEKNKNEGAGRRIAKRKKEEMGKGPPNKRPRDMNQPKDKKPRKEFVGMTAEKKKKNKFDKGQKKKKVLGEIMTKE